MEIIPLGPGFAAELRGVTLADVAADDAVYAAVTATERGRWFLSEFANRHRAANTDLVVAALDRIEPAIGGITAENGREVFEAGADAVAVISALLPEGGREMAQRVRDFLVFLR